MGSLGLGPLPPFDPGACVTARVSVGPGLYIWNMWQIKEGKLSEGDKVK